VTSVREAVRSASRELAAADVPEPEASAETLLAELLGVGRLDLALGDLTLTAEQDVVYEAWISRRKAREPVQRILGYAYFRNLKLMLNPETLIPRPDTESVVEAALECVDRLGDCRVLDIGTGSSAIAISIAQERPGCEVHATDTSEAALELARGNAADAGAEVRFHRTDLVSGLDELVGSVDLLVSNPPYVKSGDIPTLAPEVRDWDPAAALDGGPDGLEFYRRIFVEAPPLLKDGACLVLEVGDGQAEEVLELGRRAGFVPFGERPDLTGTTRAVLLRWEIE
jgi:release factor glutamine methyltransferase